MDELAYPLLGSPPDLAGIDLKEHLIWHDGPLLSVMESVFGDLFLMWWMDCDTEANRWYLAPTDEAQLDMLRGKFSCLRSVLLDSKGDAFVVDVVEWPKVRAAWRVDGPLPDECLPEGEYYL